MNLKIHQLQSIVNDNVYGIANSKFVLHRSYKLRRSGIVTRRNYKPQGLDVQGMGVVSSPSR